MISLNFIETNVDFKFENDKIKGAIRLNSENSLKTQKWILKRF